MKPYRYLVSIAMLVATCLPGTARAEDDVAIEPWHNAFAQVRYEIEENRMSDARERLEGIVDEYDFPEVLDRASALYTETYLRERRYDEAIDFMDDALEARGDQPFERTRRLYTATERRIRRARNRAREAVEALDERYQEISWWNVFKIFDKLGRRKDLKDAEKDLAELEDLHHRFDPRYLFPVPALAVEADQDGVSDDSEATDEAADEAAEDADSDDEGSDTGDADAEESDQDDSEKSEVTETAEATETSDTGEVPEATEATEESSQEADEAAGEETDTAEASTDSEAEAEADAEAAAGGDEAGDAMNRDTAKEILASEIAALVALIPEDRLDQADAILGGTSGSGEDADAGEAGDEEAGDEGAGETETDSAAASDQTSATAETAEATEVPADQAAADPTEGTLELMPSSPDSAETSATAEVALSEDGPEVEETTASDVTSLGNLREQYYAAYQRLQQALVSGDQDAIKGARQEYLASVQAMQGTRAASLGSSTADSEGPAAPTSSTSGTADPAASQDAGGTGPAAPAATPAGTGVNPTTGFIRRDRAGIQRGVSDGGIRTSRGSLRR